MAESRFNQLHLSATLGHPGFGQVNWLKTLAVWHTNGSTTRSSIGRKQIQEINRSIWGIQGQDI
ncbi:uncharacterized protein Dmoj_GI21415 [Drosophila mojavensis]|uniref:Uncharacterized protein n=1 Tax=Drosophila mojavensis TaxID=7230 RepID=B4L9Y1_DROMO|nr:uncharacterized protein Dmoj_GI21415 [Drosophila mojavensis]